MRTRLLAGVVIGGVLCLVPESARPAASTWDAAPVVLDATERRADVLARELADVERRYVLEVHPIETRLLAGGRVRQPELARGVAWSIVVEAERRHISARLVAEVMRRENPWLVVDTVSYAGAVGLMQIMPLHLDGPASACGRDLSDPETSVCYGAAILREYIGLALDAALRDALGRYSGCVRAPGCGAYAAGIMAALEG